MAGAAVTDWASATTGDAATTTRAKKTTIERDERTLIRRGIKQPHALIGIWKGRGNVSKYRTEFMDEVARIVKGAQEEKPLDFRDFELGVDHGKKVIAHQLGMLLAGTDTDPQTNDQWEAEVDSLTAKLKAANERIQHLEGLCAQYADDNRKLKERLTH